MQKTFDIKYSQMKYNSTRGGVKGQTFEQALFSGYAADGGILLPEVIPKVSGEALTEWTKLSFTELAKVIVGLYIPECEIPREDLSGIIDRAFKTFSVPEVAPIKRLKDGVNILELFHGRTWAFKDVALSCVGQLYEYFSEKRRVHHTIVVGTSGDTGSAAIEAVRGLKWVDIIVLLPKGRCSRIQELQMTTVLEDNVHVFRADGTSDDLDVAIKPCFLDNEFREKYKLTSINSINWARIMVQIVHYFYSYLQMCPECDRKVQIVVPTGACGNVTSGCVAWTMGLPIELVCAVTCNDIVSRTFCIGDFSVATRVIPTLAPAMDIQIPYNMERLWYLFTNGDTDRVRMMMDEFEKEGKIQVPDDIANKIREAVVDSQSMSDDDVKTTMRRVWADNSYMLCPHTAIGVAYHLSHKLVEKKERVIIATASPAKFKEAVIAAGLTPEANDRVTALEQMNTRFEEMEKGQDWEKMLRMKITKVSENES